MKVNFTIWGDRTKSIQVPRFSSKVSRSSDKTLVMDESELAMEKEQMAKMNDERDVFIRQNKEVFDQIDRFNYSYREYLNNLFFKYGHKPKRR